MKRLMIFAGLLLALALPMAASAKCSLPRGWRAVGADRARIVILGEVHGSAQSPAFFGRTACALSRNGDRLLVALELSDNDGLQRAWALPHAAFVRDLSSLMPEWTSRNDGVTSQAMFAMLADLHLLKVSGFNIDVVAFNGAPDASQQQRFADLRNPALHEAIQADNISRAVDRARYRHVLVLAGNAHARRHTINVRGVSYDPMAMRLAQRYPVASLNMAYLAGTVWTCQLSGPVKPGEPIRSDQIECASHPVSGNVAWKAAARFAKPNTKDRTIDPDGAYDAAYFLGSVSASPPQGSKS